jgi:phosphoglycolate phosphatase
MRFEAAVFDFDGTLVDSAGVKYQAFFGLFSDTVEHCAVVRDILRIDPDGSRHAVIPRMIAEMARRGLAVPQDDAVAAYGRAVEAGVRTAPECPGASEMLMRLSNRMKLYVCSNTPREAVSKEIAARGWRQFLVSIHGHPERKQEVVRDILLRENIRPERLAVIGDGTSDKEAAIANGCAFLHIRRPADLRAAARHLESADV